MQRAELERVHIGTAEDLVGQLQADPDAIRLTLNLDDTQLRELTAAALNVLSPEVREQFAKRQGSHYSYGALDPNRD